MAFVGRTRLIQVSTGTVVQAWPAFVRTRAGVLALLDQTTRQTVLATPGDYTLDYQLACYYKIRVVGRRQDVGHLVLEYDVWQTKASADAGDPPAWTNTHTFGGRPKAWATMTRAQKVRWFRNAIEDAIQGASFRDAAGAEVDRRAQVDADADADDLALDGAVVELT
jgi:hypothetical protein